MESIWNIGLEKPKFKDLRGDIKTDVLIIGGGIAGLLSAYMLKREGVDCVVAEAGSVCEGVTGKTTAKITFQHGLIYDKIINRYGAEAAQLYYQSQKEALEEYKRLSLEIDCDFESKNSFVYSRTDRDGIEKEVEALNKIGCKAFFTDKTPLPFSVAGAVGVENQGQINPLKLLYTLAKDLNIFENTRVLELAPWGAVTNKGRIKAQKIIVATHFPFLNKHGAYFLKMYQHRSYVIALDNGADVDGMYIDENKKGLSFRNFGETLLLGGGSHRTGKKGGSWKELQNFAKENYPNSKEVCRWATQDCMTLDGIPYIGQYSKSTKRLYVATGFNKWGMTSAMTAAKILADLVQNRENEYSALYSPSRSIWHGQLALNAAEALIGLLTPTAPRCPHLGCALKYNFAEHTWDCSCHGSRFTEKGKVLDNPANGDKKMK